MERKYRIVKTTKWDGKITYLPQYSYGDYSWGNLTNVDSYMKENVHTLDWAKKLIDEDIDFRNKREKDVKEYIIYPEQKL